MSDARTHRARWLASVAVVIAAAAPVARTGATPAAHDVAFWQAIVDADYRLPAGQSAVGLVDELLARGAQEKLARAVRDRLESAGRVFAWSEDARLAAALLSLRRRPDVEPGLLQPWLKSLVEAQERLWSGELDPAAYAAVRAQVNTLTQLAAMLGREPDDKLSRPGSARSRRRSPGPRSDGAIRAERTARSRPARRRGAAHHAATLAEARIFPRLRAL